MSKKTRCLPATRRPHAFEAARVAAPHLARRSRLEPLEERLLLSALPASDYAAVSAAWFDQLRPGSAGSAAADRWIVRLSKESLSNVDSVAGSAALLGTPNFELQVIRGLGLPGQLLVETSGASAAQVSAWFQADSAIAYFQPDQIICGQLAPNDPNYSAEIGLQNTGQTGGTVGADINADAAWDLTTGSHNVVVAVIDSGIDYNHPDLTANIWTNPAATGPNDLHGINILDPTLPPLDDNGHGTHVAGTIGAVGNNGLGVSGVNWTTSIMDVKYLDSNLQGLASNAVMAVNYVVQERQSGVNVRVINASWGDPNPSPALLDAIQEAGNAGILLVAAAGNGDALGHSLDLDHGNGFYPASFDLSNIISVGASTPDDALAGFSNYGATTVDLVAPGVGILSTEPNTAYGTLNGTSMAAPHVSGVAALVFAYKPNASADEVRNAILQGVHKLLALAGKVATGGRLDAYRALTAQTFAPSGVLTSAPEIDVASATGETITVTYTGETDLDPTSIGDSNLIVTRNGFAATTLHVTEQSLTQSTPNQIVAIYNLGAPGGTWDATDNGTYQVTLQQGQVRDLAGLTSHTSVLGTFAVSINDPTVFFVNTTADTAAGVLSHGLKTDATNTPTSSLRAAIIMGNATPGPHTIVVPEGTYALTLAGADEDAAATGDLDIASTLSIIGGGSSVTAISGGGLDRVFDVRAGGTLNLNGVTISGGFGQQGAGILNAGTLNVTLSTITHNTAPNSGGGINNSGTLTLFRSTVSNNATTDPLGRGGGGLFNSGTATIDSSTFSGNTTLAGLAGSADGGGGVRNTGQGTVTAINSTFSGNTANGGNGGGFFSSGTVNLTNVTVADNHANSGSAGGVFNEPGASTPVAFESSFGANGPPLGALDTPFGVDVDAAGNIYVADTYHHRIQVFNAMGFVKLAFGSFGSEDGQFEYPTSVAVDSLGRIYVTDFDNGRVQVFDDQGRFQFAFGSFGSASGQFEGPYAIALDASNRIYVVDFYLDRVEVFDSTGSFLFAFGTPGAGPGQFDGPVDVDVDANARIYVADAYNDRIEVFNANGAFLSAFGGSSGANIFSPVGVKVGPSGDIFISDYGTGVQKFNSDGTFNSVVSTQTPLAIAVDQAGVLYSVTSEGIEVGNQSAIVGHAFGV